MHLLQKHEMYAPDGGKDEVEGAKDTKDELGGGEEEEEDQIIDNIGKFGKWQLKYFVLLCMIYLPCGFSILNMTFLAASTDFWCQRPEEFTDMDHSEWSNMSSPLIWQARSQYIPHKLALISADDTTTF